VINYCVREFITLLGGVGGGMAARWRAGARRAGAFRRIGVLMAFCRKPTRKEAPALQPLPSGFKNWDGRNAIIFALRRVGRPVMRAASRLMLPSLSA